MSGPFNGKSVNLFWVRFQTREAIYALQTILEEADAGELDELGFVSLEINLAHALHHICEIWHTKYLRGDFPEGSEHFNRATRSIPNFFDEFTLVDSNADLGFDQRHDGPAGDPS